VSVTRRIAHRIARPSPPPPPADDEARSTINMSRYAQLWAGSSGIYSPVSVGVSNALSHAASSACIDVLSSSIATLPVDVMRMQGDARLPVANTPPLIASPSVMVESDVWMQQVATSMLTDGNGFGFVTATDAATRPTSIDLLDPELVTDRRITDGIPNALVGGDRHQLFPWGDLWHIPGKFVRAGSPFADSPVRRAAATIGAAIAARDFGSRFFGDGGHPGGIITSDANLTAEQAAAIKQAFLNAVNGTREPAVLGSGLTYSPLMVDPNDSQFLDLMRFAVEEACRFWRVPPSMVYAATSGVSVTYANVAQADLHYLKHSLEVLLTRIERALTRLLPPPQFVRFNRNAFLRADPAARWEIYDLRLRNRSTTVNEVRALEDERPFDDDAFDVPGIPTDDPPATEEDQ